MDDPRVLLVGPESRATRAAVGPTAWVVLEELALSAEPDGSGRLVARTSVRRLGAALGLDKDTAARALSRLTTAGFVSRAASPGASSYAVAAVAGLRPADTDHLAQPARPHGPDRDAGPTIAAASSSARSRRRPAPGRDRAQLSLLDMPADDTNEPIDNTKPTTTNHNHGSDNDHDETNDDIKQPDESQNHDGADTCHPCGEAVSAPPGPAPIAAVRDAAGVGRC